VEAVKKVMAADTKDSLNQIVKGYLEVPDLIG
jgi:hypothetical protein